MSEYTLDDKKEDKEELVSWLESNEFTYRVSEHSQAIDLYLGDVLDYDTHPDAMGRSSITVPSIVTEDNRIVDEVALHLPPAEEEEKDAIDSKLDELPEYVEWVDGTRRGFGFSKIEGVVLPHIFLHDNERVSIETVKDVINICHSVYKDVYDSGDNIYGDDEQ